MNYRAHPFAKLKGWAYLAAVFERKHIPEAAGTKGCEKAHSTRIESTVQSKDCQF